MRSHSRRQANPISRREFMHVATRGLAAAALPAAGLAGCRSVRAWAESAWPTHMPEIGPLGRKFSATDTVALGSTGMRTSRLAMGTGTIGFAHHSNQTALGMDTLVRLLLNGYDNGLRFFDGADSYGSHPYIAAALKHVDRSKVTVLTKSWSRDASGMRADLDRFRRELAPITLTFS